MRSGDDRQVCHCLLQHLALARRAIIGISFPPIPWPMTWSFIECKCFGCSLPHPWSRKEKGQFVIVCPNANKAGICEHPAAQIKDFQARRGRKQSKATKRKNLNTVNWDDIPSEHREVFLQQHCAGSIVTMDGGIVGSSITGATTSPTCTSGHRNGSITLHQDIVVFLSNSSKPPARAGFYH